jgi:hypothetical protein
MASRMKATALAAIAVLAIIVLSVLQTACWPFGDSEAMTISTAQQASNGGAKASTTTSTAPTAGAKEEAAQYLSDLRGWQEKYWDNVDMGAFTFKKPTAPTTAEIKRAQSLVDQQTESVAALKLVVAPAALAQLHASYIAAIDGEAQAAQRMVRAIKNRNWRDVDLAMRDLNAAHALEVRTMGQLDDYLARFEPDSPSSAEEAGYTTFSDPTFGFSVQYPKSWKEFAFRDLGFNSPPGAVGLAVGDPSGGTFGTTPANYMFLGAEAYDAKLDGSAHTALENDLATLKNRFPDGYTVTEKARDLTLDGLEAAEATITASPQGHTLMLRLVYAHTDKIKFTFQLCCKAASLEADNIVYQAFPESLRLDTATSTAEETGLTTFTNSDVGFTVQWPKAWKSLPSEEFVDEEQPAKVTVAISESSGGWMGGSRVNLITIEADNWDAKKDNTPRETLDKELTSLRKEMTAENQLKTVQAPHSVKIAGFRAAEAIVSVTMQGHALRARECCVCTGEAMFRFTLLAEEEYWATENGVFEAIMKSLKVD